MEITVKIQHNDDMRSITLTSPTGDTLRIFSEEAIDFFHGVEQSHKHSVMQAEGSDGEHVCKYCGVSTTQPDSECYANPCAVGAAVGQRSVGTVAKGGIEKCTCPDDQCLLGDHPTCRWAEYARKSSEGQP